MPRWLIGQNFENTPAVLDDPPRAKSNTGALPRYGHDQSGLMLTLVKQALVIFPTYPNISVLIKFQLVSPSTIQVKYGFLPSPSFLDMSCNHQATLPFHRLEPHQELGWVESDTWHYSHQAATILGVYNNCTTPRHLVMSWWMTISWRMKGLELSWVGHTDWVTVQGWYKVYTFFTCLGNCTSKASLMEHSFEVWWNALMEHISALQVTTESISTLHFNCILCPIFV